MTNEVLNLLEKAEDRRRVKRRPQNSGIGEGDR